MKYIVASAIVAQCATSSLAAYIADGGGLTEPAKCVPFQYKQANSGKAGDFEWVPTDGAFDGCVSVVDYPPHDLDNANPPTHADTNQTMWCATIDKYNPNAEKQPDKAKQWGFCYDDSTGSSTAPTTAPTSAEGTDAPTTAGKIDAPTAAGKTDAPTAAGKTDAPTMVTLSPTSVNGTASPTTEDKTNAPTPQDKTQAPTSSASKVLTSLSALVIA